MDPNYLAVQPVELDGVSRPRLLLQDVYSLYGSQFRRWFGITAPISLLASVVLLMVDQRIRAIYSGIPFLEIQYHWGEIVESFVLRFAGFFISWFLGCFTLAAIATVVNGLDGDDGGEVLEKRQLSKGPRAFRIALSGGVVIVRRIPSWHGS